MPDNAPDKMTVILLAGDRGPDDPVAAAAGVSRKALADLGGQPMLVRTLGMLRASGVVGRILVVANRCFELKENPDIREAARVGDVAFLEGADTPVSSVIKILDDYPDLYPVLVTTADNPLVEPETLADFCKAAAAVPELVTVALVARKTVLQRFPNPSRTFTPLKGGAYTGCNMFLLKAPEAHKVVTFWLGIERNRKRALGFVAAFGFGALIKVFFRRIDVHQAVARVAEVIGVSIGAIILDDALAAMDIDRSEHLELAREVLGGGSDGGRGKGGKE